MRYELLLLSADQTCFVTVDRIYECGSNVSNEKECEAIGCCYNSSADVNCYYPSGEHSAHSAAYSIQNFFIGFLDVFSSQAHL